MTDDTLLDALDRLRDTGPEFEGFLANHGPMAAEVLTRVGASESVPGWVDDYRTKLDVAPAAKDRIAEDSWNEYLGDERRAGDWRDFMRREAADAPWRELVARWWPRLLPGLAASATHGVIRTAHAVRSLLEAGADPDPLLVDELAQGLGLWATRYQLLPGHPELRGDLDAVAAARALPRLPVDVPSEGPGVSGRLRSLVVLDGYAGQLDGWGPRRGPTGRVDPEAALDDLIGSAARVLAARDDAPIAFCHAVTAPAAVRLVFPVLSEELQAAGVAAAWQAVGGIVAAYASPRHPAEDRTVDVEPAPLLESLMPLAVDNGDEHVIKLSEACLREYARSADTTLLVAADRFRGRV